MKELWLLLMCHHRPPPERPPIAFVGGETLDPSTARPKVRISRKSRAGQSSSFAASASSVNPARYRHELERHGEILPGITRCIELGVASEAHPVLSTEALVITEAFNVPATYVATQAACAYSFTATAERDIVRDVIDKRFDVALDYDTQLKSTVEVDKEKTYVFPDGNIISVGAERFHCAEVPFQPSFTATEASGFRDTSLQNVMKCDVYIRKESYANAVLSSGATMFQWIFEHMTKELTALAPSTMKLILNVSFLNFFSRGGSRRAGTMNLVPSASTVAFCF